MRSTSVWRPPNWGRSLWEQAFPWSSGIPFLIVRKASKDYGTAKAIEGSFVPGERVAVVEDIVTSGGAALTAIDGLRQGGLVVEDLYCVVDREEGGREAAAARGITLRPLFTSSELGIALARV